MYIRESSVNASTQPRCELCHQDGGTVLYRTAAWRVVRVDDPHYPGFCRVILNRHEREMTDLPPAEPVIPTIEIDAELSTTSQVELVLADPVGFLTGFLTNFYSIPTADGGTRLVVPEQQIASSIGIAQQANVNALAACIPLWLTDFRADLAKLDIPTLVIHGEGDQIVPFAASGARMPQFVKQAIVRPLAFGPHGLLASHPDDVSSALLEFLA